MTTTVSRSDQVQVGALALLGELNIPPDPAALVLLANGNNSGRLTAHGRRVVAVLHRHRIATLSFDLLTDDQTARRREAFSIVALSECIKDAVDWVDLRPDLAGLRLGLFGDDAGAAAALLVAAQRPGSVAAVVSQSGRPDLAADCLARVDAPTLLIVGGEDSHVIEINRAALRLLRCHKRLEVVPGATRLFEQPGALEAAAELASDWFERQLVDGRHM